jgi:uncharacterized protein YjbI with pentapeptide repeats
MPRTLTAQDRASLIRLASSLPAGSPVRKAILAGLEKTLLKPFALNGDLKGADLSDQDLRGVDLSHKDLTGANLSGANLSRVRNFNPPVR